jgi:hypothetical protein
LILLDPQSSSQIGQDGLKEQRGILPLWVGNISMDGVVLRNAACFCEMPRGFAKFCVILPKYVENYGMRLEWNI